MMKILMATTGVAMMLIATPTLAQTSPAMPASSVQLPGQIDVQKLIGRTVTNPQNETVGEIESVIVDAGGKVRSVIVAVGGFLGMGERQVAVQWDSLTLSPNGDKIVMATTKEQLKTFPPYTFADAAQRRSVFAERVGPAGMPPLVTAPAGMPTSALGAISVSDLMSLKIRNGANETIGDIKDIVMSSEGKIQDVIVGVGGFLGMGERYVAIAWDQLRIARSGDNTVAAHINSTMEQLKAMPAFKHDRNVWVRS